MITRNAFQEAPPPWERWIPREGELLTKADGPPPFPAETAAGQGEVMAIVAVSRAVGSLGDEIAAETARRRNYTLVGQEAIHELAETMDREFRKELDRFETETRPRFLERFFYHRPVYQSLYAALIYELASRRRVVLLGRGAQIILAGIPQVLRVRILAPVEIRAERIRREREGVSFQEALQFVEKHDLERKNLVRDIYDRDPDNPELYDLVINTALFSQAVAADFLCRAIDHIVQCEPMEDVAENLRALALGKRIEAKIRKELVRSLNVRVTGSPGGKILLEGTVATQRESREMEELARSFPDVQSVTNDIRTTALAF